MKGKNCYIMKAFLFITSHVFKSSNKVVFLYQTEDFPWTTNMLMNWNCTFLYSCICGFIVHFQNEVKLCSMRVAPKWTQVEQILMNIFKRNTFANPDILFTTWNKTPEKMVSQERQENQLIVLTMCKNSAMLSMKCCRCRKNERNYQNVTRKTWMVKKQIKINTITR